MDAHAPRAHACQLFNRSVRQRRVINGCLCFAFRVRDSVWTAKLRNSKSAISVANENRAGGSCINRELFRSIKVWLVSCRCLADLAENSGRSTVIIFSLILHDRASSSFETIRPDTPGIRTRTRTMFISLRSTRDF